MKVIWENKEGVDDGLPHLVYISREKRPKHPHQAKAGAMNVLVRTQNLSYIQKRKNDPQRVFLVRRKYD